MLLTPQEVADKLRMHTNTIYRYLANGALKGKRLAGHTWRIYQGDLDEFIENRLDKCPKGGHHAWGTDGAHSNVFCKKCYYNKSGG